jgi:HD-GYP domain-containing protein (c-di-GMP phosphodiesterase class II)
MNRLDGNLIRVGEPVPCDCFDSQGQLLLKKGLVVLSQKQVDFLLERGLFGQSKSEASSQHTAATNRPASPFQVLDGFLNQLKQLFSSLAASAPPTEEKSGRTDTSASENIFPQRILGMAANLQKLCEANADALLGAIHLHNSAPYVIIHPVHRAVLCELLGRRKNLSIEDRAQLIAAALTSDLSILRLQLELFKQSTPLQPEQQNAITAHPEDTVKILRALGVSDPRWLTAVLQHHELLNGKGYPMGLSGSDISTLPRILALADTYTAMVAPKGYRKGLLSTAAMRHIILKRGVELDDELAIQVVKELGVYPPGAFVKLRSGELAIVVRRGTNPKAPTVKAMLGSRGAPLLRPIPRNTTAHEYEILDVFERDAIVAVDLHQLWDVEAA